MRRSKTVDAMTDREVLNALGADSPLAKVAERFNDCFAEIEQSGHQSGAGGAMEYRRLQLHAANYILDLFGVALP